MGAESTNVLERSPAGVTARGFLRVDLFRRTVNHGGGQLRRVFQGDATFLEISRKNYKLKI